jgi:hypothetical protein
MDNRDSDFILDLRFFNSLLGPAEPPAVITMDGVIITIGETSQRKPPSVWRLFRLSQSALAARGPYAKAAKVSLDGSYRCVLRRGALRRAVLERGASSYLDALPQLGGGCVASMSSQRSPMFSMCYWR